MDMQLTYLAIDGNHITSDDLLTLVCEHNEDVAANIHEQMERIENAETGYVLLSTAGSFKE